MKTVKTKATKQTIRVFKEQYTVEQAKEMALGNKDWAFGFMHKAKSFFKKTGKIEINRMEKQYYPFWHIKAENYQEYLRQSKYHFPVAPEVREVNLYGTKVQIEHEPVCHITAEDRCIEHNEKEILKDASKRASKDLKEILEFDTKKIKETEDLMGRGKVVIPAEVRANFLIRELFKDLMKPIQADKIIEERVAVTTLVLYFRPFHSIELINKHTGKTAVVEVDALNGKMAKGHFFGKELKEVMDEDLLFDVGAEIAATVIPGANLAAIIGKQVKKRYTKHKRQKQMEKSKEASKKATKKKKK